MVARFVLGSAMAALLFVTASASAQVDLDAAARAHFDSGTAYFETGDYEGALREFGLAYELSHRPQLLYNVYLANERLNRLEIAAAALSRYLDAVPDDRRHATLTLRLQSLRRRVAEQHASAPAAPPPEAPPVVPPPETPPVVPPPVVPPPVATARTTGRQPASAAPPLGAIVAFSAAGAGVVALGVLGAMVLDEDASLASSCGADAGRTCTEDQLSRLRTLEIGADIGLGVALAGAAIGAVLLLVRSGSHERRATRVTPWLGPSVAGLAARAEL